MGTTFAHDQSAAHVAALFEPTDLIELRALWIETDDAGRTKKRGAMEFLRAGDITTKGAVAWIARMVESKRDVYVGANPRKKAGGEAEDVALARCLFADFDGIGAMDAVALAEERGLPPATWVVASGHGCHLYWRLTEPLSDMAVWTGYQKALIATLGSDGKIHDPPRIMRLSGTTNWKGEPILCETIGGTKEPVALADMKLTPVEDGRRYLSPVDDGKPKDWRKNLARKTLSFAVSGAPEGERNGLLYKAACDVAGNGGTFDDAMGMLGGPAQRSGLEDWEIEQTIRSAFSKARVPAKPPDEAKAFSAWDVAAVPPKGGGGGNAAASQPGGDPEKQERLRAVVSNIVSLPPGEDGKSRAAYKPVEQMGREIQEASGGWPKRVGSLLFTQRESKDDLPGFRSIWTLDKVDSFGAYLHTVADVRWATAHANPKNAVGNVLTPCTKAEVFEFLKATTEPGYRAISPLPHEPPMVGVHYVTARLPGGTGERLAELLEMMNAETEMDRQLLKAMILTPGWGGEPGRRPPFVLSSHHGRGVGKTATASLIADVLWGGVLTIKPDEPFDKIIGRLLGNDGLACRCVLLDNIKGRLEGQAIEGLVTSRTIDGWRPHHGQFSRPNDLTYILTANTARLSKDLADRSVVIVLGRKKHEVSFVEKATGFVQKYRAQIIADCLQELRNPPKGKIDPYDRDRWQDWQDSVLCRCENPTALARLIIDRRAGVDDDGEDAERIAAAIRKHLRANNLVSGAITIGRDEMRELLVKAGAIEEKFGVKGCTRMIDQLIGDGSPLAALSDAPSKNRMRAWLWTWRNDPNNEEPDIDGIPV